MWSWIKREITSSGPAFSISVVLFLTLGVVLFALWWLDVCRCG
ncbi:MAG: hypothetical protein WD151_15145 [Phycisphaeraceae bacterium]